MTLEEIDQRLARYRQAADAVTANLMDLEGDPRRKLLESATLTGLTESRWSEAKVALGQLWQWFGLFKDVVDRAMALRGTKSRVDPTQLAEIERLLCGPTVELSTEQVPLGERGLLGSAQGTLRCSVDELLDRMSKAFDQVGSVLTSTGTTWDGVLPRLEAATVRLNQLTTLASSLDERHVPELNAVRGDLDRLSSSLASDPLSTDVHVADRLETTLATLGADLERLAALRDRLSAELDTARATLATLNEMALEADEAYDMAAVKISRPQVPAPPTLPQGIVSELDRIDALAARQQWRAARQALDVWSTRADQLMVATRRAADACRAPLAARNELRGRLDAYRAKANALGLLEEPRLCALYDQAHTSLYTAPTDLAAAVSLVEQYQQALSHTPRTGER